ncbi:CU044_5270 family protein [Streptomyces sp. NBC_00029]|uniref:CU044_5270 family protein n=1 Tax=Streptomyces sp. NBC_00029 TaxID=2903613 RepID=UPI003250D1CE
MNADLSRPRPARPDEDPLPLSFTERELPPGRHELHKERLMAQIHEDLRAAAVDVTTARTAADTTATATGSGFAGRSRRNPFPRRAILVPAAAFAMVGALATGGYLLSTDRGVADRPASTVATHRVTPTPAPLGTAEPQRTQQLLDRLAQASSAAPGPVVRANGFIYVGSMVAATSVGSVDGRSTLDEPHARHEWSSPDGRKAWLIESGITGPGGVDLSGNRKEGEAPPESLNLPSYDYLARLPTDPDALLELIREGTGGHGTSPDQRAFATIGDMLHGTLPPPGLTVALYRAAAKIPGVVTVDDAVDAVGRPGLAVARLDEKSGERLEWIFDRQTLAFLGERIVRVEGGSGERSAVRPGTVVFSKAVTTRAVVDRIREMPPTTG